MHQQEKYTLHWHSYSDHFREALKEMMTTSEFADVTLVTDDKQQIRAHRNILSAWSPVFKNILQLDSNNANPLIYLRGIQYSEMESIMQFIYFIIFGRSKILWRKDEWIPHGFQEPRNQGFVNWNWYEWCFKSRKQWPWEKLKGWRQWF